jgi:hypothetical protein
MGRQPYYQSEDHIQAEIRRIIERSTAPMRPADLMKRERKPRPSIGKLLKKLRRALMKG